MLKINIKNKKRRQNINPASATKNKKQRQDISPPSAANNKKRMQNIGSRSQQPGVLTSRYVHQRKISLLMHGHVTTLSASSTSSALLSAKSNVAVHVYGGIDDPLVSGVTSSCSVEIPEMWVCTGMGKTMGFPREWE